MAPGELARGFEVSRRGRDQPHVGRHRLDDEGRDLARELPERLLERRGVVVRHDRGQGGDLLGHARAARDSESRDARARRDEEAVGMAVVSAVGLDDALAARRRRGPAARRSSWLPCRS